MDIKKELNVTQPVDTLQQIVLLKLMRKRFVSILEELSAIAVISIEDFNAIALAAANVAISWQYQSTSNLTIQIVTSEHGPMYGPHTLLEAMQHPKALEIHIDCVPVLRRKQVFDGIFSSWEIVE